MSNSNYIYDSFGRKHDYLRISLTERCNLRCFYCMPEEGVELRDKAVFMTAEETIAIARTFVGLGIKKIRLTGGEPLIKKNFSIILEELSKLNVELALTTNAVLVDKYIDDFKTAGLMAINVSLDSLKEERFNEISRRNYFQRIMDNIQLLIDNNFTVKVNAVIMRDVNDNEITDFIEWTKDQPVQVRFIEFMPFDGNNWNWDKKVSFKEIMDLTESHFGKNRIEKLEGKPNDTTKNFKIKGFDGSFGIISSVTNPFCDSCNRIRLTADGKIKNCLFSSDETDLLNALRTNRPLEPFIRNAIMSKKKSRAGILSFEDEASMKMLESNRSMITIGG